MKTNSWRNWINDVLDERVHDSSGNIRYTSYASGQQNCSDKQGSGVLSQNGSKALDESCGYSDWRSIVEYYYTNTGYKVGGGSVPPRPQTSATGVSNGVVLNFQSRVSGSTTNLGWKYTIDARIGMDWFTIYLNRGWDSRSRSVPTSYKYTTSQCREYRVKASNPVGTSQYATFGTVCPS